jgi:hypothetical protein
MARERQNPRPAPTGREGSEVTKRHPENTSPECGIQLFSGPLDAPPEIPPIIQRHFFGPAIQKAEVAS